MQDTLKIQQDEEGNLFIELDENTMERLGWYIDDILEWTDNEDGTFTIQRGI